MSTTKFAFAAITAGTLVLAGVALPANADTLPSADCVTDCTATFDTVGSGFDFVVPAHVISLTATVSGAAGARSEGAPADDPSAAGGAGGVTVVDLGPAYAGTTITFGVGGVGQGSYIKALGTLLLAVAGGGGQGGYATKFSDPTQFNTGYPGGAGGSPSAPGATPGEDGQAAFIALNGTGGTPVGGGAGGTGTQNGSAGFNTTTVTTTEAILAIGGAAASETVGLTTHNAGIGGGGYTGGGGGAISSIDVGDGFLLDVAGAGGGGSGYLDDSLTATAGDPNPGAGSVTFTWSLPPVPAALASTGLTESRWIPAIALLLLAAGAGALAFRRRAARLSG